MSYRIGDRVKVTDAHPPGHVRTPEFVRGRTGTIIRHYGAFPNPERLAYGMTGLPKLDLYQVLFPMEEVRHRDGANAPGDTLTAEIYEHWLVPGEEQQ